MNGVAASSFREEYWPGLRHFIGGYASGCALVLAGHPFDTVKVRMQTEGKSGRFRGPLHCTAETIRKEGLRGLYKGVTPPLVATGVINSLLFGMQGFVTRNIKADKTAPPTVRETAVSAIITGAAISTVVAPMEGIKARLQVQYNAKGSAGATYAGPIDAIRKVYGKLGLWNGLYRGWLPTAMCRMSNYAYFGSYALIKSYLAEPGQQKLSLGASVLAGGGAGICYWLSCYPIDLVKNKIQAAPDTIPPRYAGIRHAAGEVYAAGGARALFTGFSPALVRAFPANAACFVAFEIVMYLLPE